jgi:hypothetical protein
LTTLSIDGRLRNDLTRDASLVDIDASLFLDPIVTGGRRRRRLRRAAGAAAILALAAIVVLAGPAVLAVIRHEHQRPAEPVPTAPGGIVGTYAARILTADVRGVRGVDLQGLWQLTLRSDGLINVVTPRNAGISSSPSEYQIEDDRILTTAFASNTCSGVGVYRWSRFGSTLRFTLVSDACDLRVAIFVGHTWEAR